VEKLLEELELLRRSPDLPTEKMVGAIIATAARCKDILDARMVAVHSLATAVAMQPQIDALKLHDDFVNQVKAHYAGRHTPPDVTDVALTIELAAPDRR